MGQPYRAKLYVAATIVALVAGSGQATELPSAPERHIASYATGALWPDDMTWLCLEDQTHGFPVSEAAAEFADFIPMRVMEKCPETAYVVEILTEIDQSLAHGATTRSEFADDRRISSTITLNLAIAFKQDPRKWRILLIHELGHTVGLDHTFEYDSVMHPYGEMYSHDGLTETDRQQLAELLRRTEHDQG